MNAHNAAVAHASVSASSANAVSEQVPSSRPGARRKRAGVSGTLDSTRMAKGNLQTASEIARRDRIVLEHLPLVKAIATRVHGNLPVDVDLDDLVHAGVVGLFDAANDYQADTGIAFSSYAKHRIKGTILDSLRQLARASHKGVEAATRDFSARAKG